MLGGALAVLEGRSVPARVAVVVVVPVRPAIPRVERAVGVDREHPAGEREQPARRGSLMSAPVRRLGGAVELLLDRLAPVNQDV